MNIHLLTYIIVCPLVFLAGFVDAIAGGGGLISLPAYMIAGIPAHFAISTNKMSSSLGTALTTYRFSKLGLISWKNALPCVLFALIGSTLGAKSTLFMDELVFKKFMLLLLPLTGCYILFKKNIDKQATPYSKNKTFLLCFFISLIIGFYDGFYGPGTGTFLILALTSIAHISLNEAAGTTKVINLTTNISALTVFLMNGTVLLPLGLVAGIFSIAGNYFGSKLFTKKGSTFVKPLILFVLSIFFIKVLLEVL